MSGSHKLENAVAIGKSSNEQAIGVSSLQRHHGRAIVGSRAEDHNALTCLSNKGHSHEHNIKFRLTPTPHLNTDTETTNVRVEEPPIHHFA